MRFRIGSHLLDAEVQCDERPPSERAGAGPRRLVIQFRAEGTEAHEEYVELVQAAGEGRNANESGMVSSTSDGRFDGSWRIAEASYTVRPDGDDVAYVHTWELEEHAR